MRKLNAFDDYLLDKLFESSVETPIILSDRLYDLLDKINHPISRKLRLLNTTTLLGDKITLIDYDDKNNGNFTYIIPSKLIKGIETSAIDGARKLVRVGRNNPDIWQRFRNSSSIGKVVNKIFPGEFRPSGEPGNDLQSFTDNVILERTKSEKAFERFKVVEGNDINKYYDGDNYNPAALHGSTLGGSCMRYKKCQSFIDFYSKNKGVKLIVLFSEEEELKDKIIGRALLWDIEYIDDNIVDRKYMDRIYYIYESDMMLFKEYAKRNGWLYKKDQNMYADGIIIDSLTNEDHYLKMKTTPTFTNIDKYPYLDTLKYFVYNDGYLTNREDRYRDYYTLNDTNGYYEDYEDENRVYVDYYSEYFDSDDLQWCEYGDDNRTHDDAVYLEQYGEYATQQYIDRYMIYSENEDGYIMNSDAVFSDYLNDHITKDNSTKVFKEGASDVETLEELNDYDDFDYVDDYSLSDFIEYNHDGNDFYFSKDDEDNFIQVKSLFNSGHIYIHKVWDKDRIFKHDGEYYLDDGGQELKDNLINQTRLFK